MIPIENIWFCKQMYFDYWNKYEVWMLLRMFVGYSDKISVKCHFLPVRVFINS